MPAINKTGKKLIHLILFNRLHSNPPPSIACVPDSDEGERKKAFRRLIGRIKGDKFFEFQ